MLLEKHSIPQSTLDAHLTIVQGSSTDVSAVKALLAHGPSTIISGVGAAPKLNANPLRPFVLDQPTICADTAAAVVAALRELSAAGGAPEPRPHLAVISSTGVGVAQDLPPAMRPLYRWGLAAPHADKRAMEVAVVDAALAADSPLAGFVVVRPAFLLDGKGKGMEKVKAGWERHARDEAREAGPGPAVGYTIARADVGGWIFEELVKGNVEEWDGRCVSLTY
jgi:NAD(P)H-binding